MDNPQANLLAVRDLKTQFFTEAGVVRAVDGVSFDVRRGEVVGIVGESGCGKSVTSLSIMQLVGRPGQVVSGEILFDNQDLLRASEAAMQQIRGNRIAMIFQQPQSCLNPVFRIGDQLVEVLDVHQKLDRKTAVRRAVELLTQVGIPEPEARMNAYPHELSGGMAQRVMIALALACLPELLIADEPTTALDVTIQAQILDLMRDLRARLDMAMILITHDLGVIAETCDRVYVMYAGQFVEAAPVVELFCNPRHPYTQGLIAATPLLGEPERTLHTIPGAVPHLAAPLAGCAFAPRCAARVAHALTVCTEAAPALEQVAPGHWVRCWLDATREGG